MGVLAFTTLGFLIGNLVGFTAGTITASIIPLLFAFGGGSAVAFFQKLAAPDRRLAAGTILSLSVGCLLGIYFGLFVSERQLLTPAASRGDPVATALTSVLETEEDPEVRRIAIQALGEWQNKKDPAVSGPRYLRSETVEDAHAIDQRLVNERLTIQQAYDQMYQLVTSDSS